MMQKFCFLFILLFSFSYGQTFGQTNTDEEYVYKPKKLSNRQKNKRALVKAIKQLKEGGAVIYLVKDRKTKTDALKEKGMEAKAIELEKKRMEKQKFMVKAFADKFKFCPIYFCNQSDIEKIQNGEIQGNLLDTSLTKNSSIAFNHSYFLILDYGNVYDIQGQVYCDTCKTDYTGQVSLKENCFVFKNKYLSQLNDPFPFFTTCHYPQKEILVKIRKMNQKLFKFYQKNN